MIKLGLKNYFKSFRFFFVPLGALSLGIVAGLSVMFPMILGAIKAFIKGVAELAGQITFDWNAVKDTLYSAFQALDWANPENVWNEIAQQSYWTDLLKRCAEVAFGDMSGLAEQFQTLVQETIAKIVLAFVLSVLLSVLGAIVGYFSTRSLIRGDIAKRSFKKAILRSLADAVIKIAVLSLGVFLAVVEKHAILFFLLTVVLYGAISFFGAYLVHGYKKISLKTVMTIKNFFKLFLLTILEILIMMAIFGVVYAVTNVVIGLYVSFAVFVITAICLQLNAEAYVKTIALQAGGLDDHAFAKAYGEIAPAIAESAEREKEELPPSNPAAVEEELIGEDPAPAEGSVEEVAAPSIEELAVSAEEEAQLPPDRSKEEE